MNSQFSINKPLPGAWLALVCLGPWASASAELIVHAPVDKASVTAIRVELDPEHWRQFGFQTPPRLAAQIGRNLAEWRYPISAEGPASHRLLAGIGLIHKGSTPVGFSFSSGNSDPRAADFQTAQVLPIACSLSAADSPKPLAEYQTSIDAHDWQAKPADSEKVLAKLSDAIGTACFNLLDELDLPTQPEPSGQAPGKPAWLPNVRIEVKNAPAVEQSNKPAETAAEPATELIEQQDDNQRKQIIIHNQGTPLILEFGHQRR